jgi:hypothetical protein
MSCNDNNNVYRNSCCPDTPYPNVQHESVPSLIDNLVDALYGEITKTVSGGRVVWDIPCDPTQSPAEVPTIPREQGEGLLCYLMRIFQNTVGQYSPFQYWSYTGTGSQTTFALNPSTNTLRSSYLVYLNGVVQPPTAYSISNTNPVDIVFTNPPANGVAITVLNLGYTPPYVIDVTQSDATPTNSSQTQTVGQWLAYLIAQLATKLTVPTIPPSGIYTLATINGVATWQQFQQLPPVPSAVGQVTLVSPGSSIAPSWQSTPAIAIGPITATGSTTPRFVADRFADALNVKDFGAVGDGKIVLGGSISSGSSTLTVSGGSFVAGDIGKQIVVEGAGSNKNSLFTTIGSVTSATQVGLSASASSTVSNRRVVYGTDDSDAIRAARDAGLSQGRSVSFPTATYLLMKTSNGNTHTQFQNPSNSGAFIDYVNSTTSVSKTFALFGNGSTLLSPVYPATNASQVGSLVWIAVDGRWDNAVIDGFNFVCTHPLVESRVRGEATFFTIGSTVAIQCYWDSFGNASEFGINRPNNLVVQNCQSKDFNHFLNAWAANNLKIANNVITAEYGYPSTGNGDEVNQSITTRYAVGGVVIENNLFNGCTANDVSSITMAPSSFQGRAYPQDGLLFSRSRDMVCRNNVIVRYGFEGILVNPDLNGSASVTTNFLDNAFPIGAGRREEQAIACNGQDITVANNFIQNSQLGISTYFDSENSRIAILNNTVHLLPLKENSVWQPSYGIYLGSANNSVVSGNTILGANIGNIVGQQNWDGSIATIPPGQPPELDIATGIIIVGNKTPVDGENTIENNYIAIQSRENQNITVSIDIPSSVITWANHGLSAGTPIIFKTTGQLPTGLTAGTSYYIVNPSTNSFQVSTTASGAAVSLGGSQFGTQTASVIVLINAIKIGSGAGNYLIKNNTVNNCDFLYSCGRGGVTMTLRFDSNVFNNGQRLVSKWGVYPPAYFINSPIEFRPTETGWYICDSFPSNTFRVNSGRLGINVSSNSWYPDVVDSTQLPKAQSTELEYGFVTDYSDPQTPQEIMVMNQISHTGNPDCAITKAYLVSDGSRAPQLYLYVNRILEKIRIRFLGGNGNAIGECAVVNGVATGPVTITTAGSGYSSGNTFGDLRIGAFGQATFIESKTEPIFNLTVAGGTVTGATITNGGSGLSQPIYIESKATTLTNVAWWSATNILKSANPNFGYEMEFRLGTQCTRRRRDGNLIVGSGTPQFANVPPSTAPKFIGEVYFDENNDILYVAHGTSSSSDWKAIATWNP